MAQGKINYQINFNVNQSGLKKVEAALANLQNLKFDDLVKINNSSVSEARSSLKKIQDDAHIVEKALSAAFNPKLNSINIKTFNNQLAKNKTTLSDIYTSFSKAGTVGEAAFRSLASQALNMNMQIKESHAWLDKMATTLGNTIKWNAASAAVNGLTRSVQQAWGFIKNLDNSLNDIRIVTGKSGEEMARFAEQANKAAGALGRTTTDYTKAALIYAQQGLSDAEVQERTRITLTTANVTGQSTEDVSQQLTAVWNGYKVNAEEAELYVDRLAAIAATTASDLEQLSTGMSKVASAAAAMGVGEDQLAAQLSTIISVTQQAPESVGTALRTVYARISDIKAGIDQDGVDLGRYSGKMAELGFNVLDANGKLRDMGTVMEEIGNRWQDLTREQQVSLAQTMAGQRQYSNLIALFDNFEQYNKALATAQNAAGTLQDQQSIYMESMKAHLNELTAAVEGIYKSFSDPKSINGFIDGLTSIAKLIDHIVTSIGGGGSVLTALGAIGVNVFSNQIAASLQTTIDNTARAKIQAAEFEAVLENIRSLTAHPQKFDDTTLEMLNNKEKLASMSGRMSVEDFNTGKKILQDLVDESNKFDVIDSKIKILKNSFKDLGEEHVNLETLLSNSDGFDLLQDRIDKIKTIFSPASQAFENFKKGFIDLQNGIASGTNVSGIATSLQKNFDDLILKLKGTATEASEAYKMLPQEARKSIDEISGLKIDFSNPVGAIEQFKQVLTTLGPIISGQMNIASKDAKEVSAQWEALGKQGEEVAKIVSKMEKAWRAFLEAQQKKFNVQDITKFFTGLASLGSSIKNLSNIGNIISDKSLTNIQKTNQIFTNMVSTLPMLIMGLTRVKDGLIGFFNLSSGASAALTAVMFAVTAVGTLIAGQAEAERKRAEEEHREAKEAIQAENKKQEAIEKSISSLEKLRKQYQSNEITRSELRDGLKDLLEQYGQEQTHLDKLIEKYGGLSEAIAGFTADQIKEELDSIQIEQDNARKNFFNAINGSGEDQRRYSDRTHTYYNGVVLDSESLDALVSSGNFESVISNAAQKGGEFVTRINRDDFLFLTDLLQHFLQENGLKTELYDKGYIELNPDQLKEFRDYYINNSFGGALNENSDLGSIVQELLRNNLKYIIPKFEFQTEGAQSEEQAAFQVAEMQKGMSSFAAELSELEKRLEDQGYLDFNDQLKLISTIQEEINLLNSQDVKNYPNVIKERKQKEHDLALLQSDFYQSLTDDNLNLQQYYEKRQELIEKNRAALVEQGYTGDELQKQIKEDRERIDKSLEKYTSGNYQKFDKRADFLDKVIEKTGQSIDDIDKGFLQAIQNADLESLSYLSDEIIPKYGEKIKSVDDFIDIIKKLQNIDFTKPVKSLEQATDQYVLYSSLLDEVLNNKNHTINKSTFEKLQPEIQSYFTMMANGTYQLTSSVKDFTDAVNKISLSGLQQVGDSFLERKQVVEETFGNTTNTTIARDQIQKLADVPDLFEKIASSQENSFDLYKNLTNYQQELLQKFAHDDYSPENVIDAVRGGIANGLSYGNIMSNLSGQASFVSDEYLKLWLDQAEKAGFTNSNMQKWRESYAINEDFSEGDIREQIAKFLINVFQNINTDEIADELEKQYLSTQIQIASSAKDMQQLDRLKEDYDLDPRAYAYQQVAINKQQDIEDLDLDQLQQYTDYLQQIADKTEAFDDTLTENDQAAQIVAKSIMNMNNGLQQLTKNWEEWSKVLSSGAENTKQYADAIQGVQQAVSNLLDVSEDYVSQNFIKQNLDLIGEAANGSQEAIDELRDKLGEEIVLQIAINHGLLDSQKENLLNEFVSLQEEVSKITLAPGAELDDSKIIDQLNNMIDQFGLSVDQVNALLDSISYEPEFDSDLVELPQTAPVTQTQFTPNGSTPVTAHIMGFPVAIDFPNMKATTKTTGTENIPGTTVSVPKIGGKGQSPHVKKITKKASGSYSNPVSSSGKKSGGSGGGRGGSGGGSGSAPKPNTNQKDPKKQLEDERDIYHDINIQIQKINRGVDRLQKEQDRLYGKKLLDNLSKQSSLLEQQKQKLQQKAKLQEEDLKNQQEQLKTLGAVFDQYGNIANYMQVLGDKQDNINNLTNKYNDLVKLYNASTDSDYKSAIEDEMKYYEKAMQQAQEDLSKTKTKIGNYDSLRDAMEDLKDEIQQITQKQIEINIKKFKYEVEIRLDMKEAANDWNKFRRQVLEHTDVLSGTEFEKIMADARQNQADIDSYFNVGTGGRGYLEALTEQAMDLREQIQKIDETGWSDIYGDNKAQAMEDLKDDLSKLSESLEDIQSLIDNIDEAYLDTIDDIEEQWDKQIEDYEFVNDLLQHNIDLVELLYGDKNFNAMDRYYEQMYNNGLRELDSLAKQRDFWKQQWDQALANGQSVAAQKFKENWMNSVNSINEQIESSIKLLKDKYENSINSIFDTLNNQITNGKGLDYVGFEWDLMNEKAQDYLDTINSAFAIQQTERKYQTAINDTKNIKNQKALRDLMDEQLSLLRNKQKVTQYDVDRAEKLLQVQQARIALEDMRSAKTALRLKRDSQGNYSYEYHADNDAIAQAQDDLAAAQNDLYNFDKAAYQTNLQEIYDLWQEYLQKYKDINLDASLSDEERQIRLDELTETYGDRINLRLEDNMNVRNNLYDSAFASYADLYDNNLQNFDQMLNGEDGMIPMWNSGIQQMADKMTAQGGFLPVCQDALTQVEEQTEKWKEKIEETAEVAGVKFDEIGQGVDQTKERFSELIEENDELLDRFTLEQLAAQTLKNYLSNLADEYTNVYNEAVGAVGQLYNFVQAQQEAAASANATASAYEDMIQRIQSANAAYIADPYGGYTPTDGSSGSSGGSGSGSGSNSGSSSNPSNNLNEANLNKVTSLYGGNYNYATWSDDDPKKYKRYATGGYTGDWTDRNGRLAILDSKELVLNQKDTENLLDSIKILRNIMFNADASAGSRLGSLNRNKLKNDLPNETIEQNVKIEASFPNVNSKREIEEAFDNLVNLAAQKVLH